ncbi:MAG TPA: hypothetical protein HA349_10355 [Methanotrichaceae archaeon]|nr:hypothetical protein [Methanotrichaceae archaeon]
MSGGGPGPGVLMLLMALVILGSLFFEIQGINMHSQVDAEEAKFHILQKEYWILDKSTRDSAPTGSDLNEQLVEIQNYPSELLRLKLVGVGKMLTGIYILLVGILVFLIIMPMRLGRMLKK